MVDMLYIFGEAHIDEYWNWFARGQVITEDLKTDMEPLKEQQKYINLESFCNS